MGYQIQYSQLGYTEPKKKGKGKIILSVFLVALLLITAVSVKTTALPFVRDVLIPGDPAITTAAFETMVDQLQQCTSLPDAIKAFCLEILSHAHSTQ